MPAGFERCIRQGGRVRTIKPKPGRYLHVCYLGGKSYSGEVKHTKEESDEYLLNIKGGETMKDKKQHKKKTQKKDTTESFTESLTFSIQEGTLDEEKRTVRVCALAPCISKNNRYYSPEVVESVSGTLTGKKSFADHDQRDTKNLVGRITSEEFKEGKLYADIRISKASGIAKSTFQKISEGIITDVSIAADGKTKRMKLGDKKVDAVSNLDVKSVDFVTEGGVRGAKVLHVWENIKDIPTISEVKEEMIENVEQLREQYPDLVVEVEEKLKDELDVLRKENDELKKEKIEKELSAFKEKEISKLDTTDKVKGLLKDRVTGKNKEELSASIEKEFDYIKQATEAVKKDAKTDDIPANKKKKNESKDMNSESIREDARIPQELKGDCIKILWAEGSDAVKNFLKSYKVEI